MKRLSILFLFGWPLFAQLPFPTIDNSAGDVFRSRVNQNFSWLYTNKSGTSHTHTTATITESGNLYFTNARALSAMAGLYEVPITFASPLVRSGNAITCPSCASGAWGSITGSLSAQTDIVAQFALKAPITSGSAPLKGNGSGGTATVTAPDIVGLFNGTPGPTLFLRSDGQLVAPGGTGNTTSTNLTTGRVPLSNGTNSVIDSSLVEDTTSVSTTKDFAADGAVSAGTGDKAGILFMNGNASTPDLPDGQAGFLGPISAVATPWAIRIPVSGPTAAGVMTFSAPVGNIATLSFSSVLDPTLGGTGIVDLTFAGASHQVATQSGTVAAGGIVTGSPTGDLVQGPNSEGTLLKTSNYTVLATDCGKLLTLSSTSNRVLSLPAAAPADGCRLAMENINTGTWTISRNGLSIDDAGTDVVLRQNQGFSVRSNGTSYYTEDRGITTVSVNGTQVAPPNFSTTPVAEANNVNVVWQLNSGTGAISAEVPASPSGASLGVVKGSSCNGGSHYSGIGSDGSLTCTTDSGSGGGTSVLRRYPAKRILVSGTPLRALGKGPSVPFAFLPACAAAFEGYNYSVSDSSTFTFGATVAGGSTHKVRAFCNGTNWTVAAI